MLTNGLINNMNYTDIPEKERRKLMISIIKKVNKEQKAIVEEYRKEKTCIKAKNK
jgi:hypothetical protein